MLLHVSQDLAAEVKEVLKCSPQWSLQENTWATFERGEDIIVVEQYRTDGVLDMLAIFGPVDKVLANDLTLPKSGYFDSLLWFWIESPVTIDYIEPVPSEITKTVRSLVDSATAQFMSEPPF